MRRTVCFWMACLLGIGLAAHGQAPRTSLAERLLEEVGVTHGVCAVVGGADEDLILGLVQHSGLVVHAMDARTEVCDALRKAGDAARLDLHRLVVEQRPAGPLPHIDNFLDAALFIDLPDLSAVAVQDVLRALRPGAAAIAGNRQPDAAAALEAWAGAGRGKARKDSFGTWIAFRKPATEGVDDWTHWEHRPDNNPVSTDACIKAPYMTQWLAQPYYIAMPAITLAAGGRTFLAMGHIAHHEREEQWLNTILARNGYNGQELWRMRLPDGYLVHRSAFVATADTFYMIDLAGQGCLMLDPETGKEKGRIDIPQLSGQWKWMAIQDDVLYVLAGREPDPAQTTVVRSQTPAWSWNELSSGYYQERIPWGFGETITAFDLRTNRQRWIHQEQARIDSRAMALGENRVYFYGPDSHLGCLDAGTGRTLWTNDDADLRALIEEPGRGLSSTPGFRTTCFCVYTPKGLFFEGQTKMNLVAVNKETGALMWHHRKTTSNPNVIYVDGAVYAGVGENGNTLKLDPMTGTLLQDLGFRKRSCARLTATPDSLFCRGYAEGVTRFDRVTGQITFDGSMRPACNDGMMGANGLLYSGPWLCDCNLSIIGAVAQCSANGFDPASARGERVEFVGRPAPDPAVWVTGGDWFAYRGGNEHNGSSKVPLSRAMLSLWTWPDAATDAAGAQEGRCQSTAPVAAWGKLFLGGDDGKVRAFDAVTGTPLWTFATAGAILQPPTLWKGRVFVGSGDGYVYALDAGTGQLAWRFRAAPAERRTMIYGLLGSTWPVNSGVVIKNGVAYFAAGIIDYDGTYVYAVDAETGALRWANNSSGHLDKALRKGVSAQGNVTLLGDALWLGAGNVMPPAPYALDSGALLSNHLPGDGTPTENRGEELGVLLDRYLVYGGRLRYSSNENVVNPGSFGLSSGDDKFMDIAKGSVVPAWDDSLFVCVPAREAPPAAYSCADLAGNLERGRTTAPRALWRADHLKGTQVHALALAANAVVAVYQMPVARSLFPRYRVCLLDRETGRPLWEQDLPGAPRMNGTAMDRDGRLIVGLNNGGLTAFGDAAALRACLGGLAALPGRNPAEKDELVKRLYAALDRVQNPEGRQMLMEALGKQGIDAVGAVLTNGAIAHWRLLDPVPWADDAHPADSPLPGEPDLRPDRPVKLDKETLEWRDYVTADREGKVDLAAIFGTLEHKAVYACADFESAEAGERVLTIGCNDGHTCWLNGVQVGRFDGGRLYQPGQDHFAVRVKAGPNRILVKSTQLGGAWAFNVRFLGSGALAAPLRQ